jgi:predicted enzyme related to lactoylglutathione lyase
MPRVVHFEINADNPERAGQFYNAVFGWEIKKWEGSMEYWLVMTGPKEEMGINGGIMRREDPSATTVNTVAVPSYDEYAAKILENGGKQVMPKTAVPGMGWFGYFTDTEGNTFGIMEMDESAA